MWGLIHALSPLKAMLFGAIVSATDPVRPLCSSGPVWLVGGGVGMVGNLQQAVPVWIGSLRHVEPAVRTCKQGSCYAAYQSGSRVLHPPWSGSFGRLSGRPAGWLAGWLAGCQADLQQRAAHTRQLSVGCQLLNTRQSVTQQWAALTSLVQVTGLAVLYSRSCQSRVVAGRQ